MKVAVEGCCHGELDSIYNEIARLEQQNKYKVDLLLICGDFQAVRNHQDLQCMAVPDKYKKLGEFHKWVSLFVLRGRGRMKIPRYYTGDKTAPVLTVFIGGNHEASNYLWELYHGGWAAPNIYYLGHAGCVQVNGVRIAGASGIFKGHDFRQGHHEHLPYDKGSLRSAYHIREFNVRRLSLLSSPTVFLSHDWPASITRHGNQAELLRRKPFFKDDVFSGKLGSPPMMGLLRTLKPAWWFSAHLHCRFEASVVHERQEGGVKVVNPDEIVIDEDEDMGGTVGGEGVKEEKEQKVPVNPDEITLSDEEEDVVVPPRPATPPPAPKVTKFLALDKCLPRRQYLEIIDIPTPDLFNPSRPTIAFDPEWLAITRAFQPYLSLSSSQPAFPDEPTARQRVAEEMAWVRENVYGGEGSEKEKRVGEVQKFVMSAPGPTKGEDRRRMPPFYPNPQTAAFCNLLDIENKIDAGASPARTVPVQAQMNAEEAAALRAQLTCPMASALDAIEAAGVEQQLTGSAGVEQQQRL
ncbi:hypothetical protein OE88DRAFT_1648923 [Heliocybe sulcata]|uniref:Lariat debranching enzyme C-terminal domain-containing protein n=1 Tax=Heliocybe sulcata TaxID=5364 RepID=A0A5C3MME6_9AGAM|nr:hypothetical protein OE88DRAFT_1648923 [Heliocybe sulcata]